MLLPLPILLDGNYSGFRSEARKLLRTASGYHLAPTVFDIVRQTRVGDGGSLTARSNEDGHEVTIDYPDRDVLKNVFNVDEMTFSIRAPSYIAKKGELNLYLQFEPSPEKKFFRRLMPPAVYIYGKSSFVVFCPIPDFG